MPKLDPIFVVCNPLVMDQFFDWKLDLPRSFC